MKPATPSPHGRCGPPSPVPMDSRATEIDEADSLELSERLNAALGDPAPVDPEPGVLVRKRLFDAGALVDDAPPPPSGEFVRKYLHDRTDLSNDWIPAPPVPEPVVPPSQPAQPDAEPDATNDLDDEPGAKATSYKTSDKHRENSRAWHKTWVKKGVRREAAPQEPHDGDVGPHHDVGGGDSNRERPLTLTQAKDKFISEWIKTCGMAASNDRRVAAIKAWMESDTRANYLASRAGVQK